MTDRSLARERLVWMAVVVALGTSLAWLVALDLAFLLRFHADRLAPAFAVGRALVRVALAIVRQGWLAFPMLLMTVGIASMLVRVRRPEALAERRVRHG